MANITSLQIIKTSANQWVFRDNTMPVGGQPVVANAYSGIGTTVNAFSIQTKTGHNIYNNVPIAAITYVDQVTPANSFTPTSAVQLVQYLKNDGFFGDGSGGGGDVPTFLELPDVFASSYFGRKGQIPAVDNSEMGLIFIDPGNIVQNNKGKSMTFTLPVGVVATLSEIVNRINNGGFAISPFLPFTVTSIQTPIAITVIENVESVSKRYVYLFFGGQGSWGGNGPDVNASQFYFISVSRLTPEDIKDDPNAVINNIDPVVDGDFITKANTIVWDFGDSGEVQPDGGVRSYYFTYTDDGVLYFALFIGDPGIYGGTETPFTEDDFVVSTNSAVSPDFNIPVWRPGTYAENNFVTNKLNGQMYLFRSTTNSNTTKPLLNANRVAWGLSLYGGSYVGDWTTGPYVVGNIVSRQGWAYYCLTNNTNSDPVLLTYNNWLKLGIWADTYVNAFPYSKGMVVRDSGNIVHISNFDNNTYPLNYGIVSNWEVVNGMPNTIVAWGDSLTEGLYSTADQNYPSILSTLLGENVLNKGVSGETSTQIKTRFMAEPDKHYLPQIICAGRNNAADTATVVSDIYDMTQKLSHDRYLVIGIIKHKGEDNNQVDILNSQLKTIYGDRFVDLQAYMLTIYDPDLPQDVADHAAGYIAGSNRSDYLHLSNKGNFYMASFIASRFLYLQGTPKIKMTIDPYDLTTNLPAKPLLKLNGTGEIQAAPSIGSGYIPFENGQGVYNTSPLIYNGTNLGVFTGSDIEDGFKFQINGPFAVGTKGSARLYQFTIDAETSGIQSRDLNLQKDLKLFIRQLLIGNSASATANGEIAVFGGEVKISPAVQSTSAVTKDQVTTKIGNVNTSPTYNITTDGKPLVMVSFSGSVTPLTATLEPASDSLGKVIFLTNKTTTAVVINTTGGANEIWDTGVLTNTLTIQPGTGIRLHNDGTYNNI